MDIRNDNSGKTKIFYVNDFKSLLTTFLREELSDDGQGSWLVGGSVLWSLELASEFFS